MLSNKEQELIEKVVTGGGATGVSSTADPVAKTATLPNSKKQGDSMQKGQNPAGTGIEDTDPASNVKPTGDNSAQNKASVAMKGSAMKEELAGLFGEDATEEMLEKASAMFEAALAVKVAELEEDYAEALDREVAEIKEELTEQVDQYLSFAATEWLSENEVAIENSLKNELTEEFIEGLKNLFAEHYIEIPDSKVDVVEALSRQVEELEEKLNDMINEKMELSSELTNHKLKETFDEVSEGLALSQIDKFKTIAENLEFNGDIKVYRNKLETIKENYFSGKTPAASNILTEDFTGEVGVETKPVTGDMGKYVAAISRTLKK